MAKPKLIMYKGLPASGKTSAAKEHQNNNPNTKRVNKDDLRAMLDNSAWSKDNEKTVLYWRDTIVAYELRQGNNVIVDDTNLHPKHEIALRALATQCDADFEIVDLTSVPLEECIQRDAKRPNSVGKKVILSMWNQFLKPVSPQYNPKLPDVIISDVDGTTCLFEGKNAYSRDFENDTPNTPVLRALSNPLFNVIFVSGRSDKHRYVTESWFKRYDIKYQALYMRAEGDNRDDTIVKKEIYDTHIKDKYNVLGVFDDRLKVIRLWWSLGLFVFNVNQGNVEF